jgi:hypothetical protein
MRTVRIGNAYATPVTETARFVQPAAARPFFVAGNCLSSKGFRNWPV